MSSNLRTTLTASAAILLMAVAPAAAGAESPQAAQGEAHQAESRTHAASMHAMHERG